MLEKKTNILFKNFQPFGLVLLIAFCNAIDTILPQLPRSSSVLYYSAINVQIKFFLHFFFHQLYQTSDWKHILLRRLDSIGSKAYKDWKFSNFNLISQNLHFLSKFLWEFIRISNISYFLVEYIIKRDIWGQKWFKIWSQKIASCPLL
jgi:hypothetical protein